MKAFFTAIVAALSLTLSASAAFAQEKSSPDAKASPASGATGTSPQRNLAVSPSAQPGHAVPQSQVVRPGRIWANDDERIAVQTPWANRERYRDCDFGCLYEKGNENLALQGVYIIEKMLDVEKMGDVAQEENKGRLRALLGSFCVEEERDSIEKCKARYMRTQLMTLRKVRNASAANSDAAAQLRSGGAFGGQSVPVFAVLENGKTQKPLKSQVPSVPTLEELREQYSRDSAALSDMVSIDYQRWVEDKRNFRPSIEDFYKMETIPRDPQNPRAGTISRVARGRNGEKLYDKNAYDLAMKNHLEREKITKNDELTIQEQDRRRLLERAKKPSGLAEMQAAMADGSENARIYNISRRRVVGAVNKMIRESGAATSARRPANRTSEAGRGMQTTHSASPQTPITSTGIVNFGAPAGTVASSVKHDENLGEDQILDMRPTTQETEDLHISLDLGSPEFKDMVGKWEQRYGAESYMTQTQEIPTGSSSRGPAASGNSK